MEAKDLMKGDWVLSGGKCLKVVGLTDKITLIDDTPTRWIVEEVQPIPLTPEILEKNGFLVKHPESEKRTYLKDRAGQIVVHKNRGLLFFNISGNPWKFGWFNPAFAGHIRFVHELQRALKMCNIEKEITL